MQTLFQRGHNESHCWKLHLEMKPKKFNKKRKKKTVATPKHDLGSDFGNETMITTMGMEGKDILNTRSFKFS